MPACAAAWPDPADPGRVHGLREDVEALYHHTDTCIVAGVMCGGPFEQACCLRGFQDFCFWAAGYRSAESTE